MKTLKTVGIVLALLFTVVAAAEAIDLYTPLLYVNGTDFLYCSIVNVSTTDKTVRIRIIEDNGNSLNDGGDHTVEPGHTYTIGVGFDGSGYCRFTVSGSKTQVRAAAKIRPDYDATETIAIRAE